MIPRVHETSKGKIGLELMSSIVIRINQITDTNIVDAGTISRIINLGGVRGNRQGAIDIGGIATVEIR